jgi:G:T-mismatch repair DNA endonuclease (very short patch repair protein)
MKLAHLGKKHTVETRAKISESHLGEKNPNYGKHPSPETRVKLVASRTGSKNHQYGKPRTQETRAKISNSLKGEYNFNYGKPRESYIVRKIMQSNRVKPNKAELRLQHILETHFPGQWRFVGDGHLIIGGLCPDFLNINNKKEIIELFGSYWHSEKQVKRANQTEAGRIKHYEAYSFRCLIVWENELKDEVILVQKIKGWTRAV